MSMQQHTHAKYFCVIGPAINGSAISLSVHCLFRNMNYHAVVSREDKRYQGLSVWGFSRGAMVHAVDGKNPGHSP